MSNRYLPSITLSSDILDEIITATQLEVDELKMILNKYNKKGNKEAAKVTVEMLFAAMRKLTSYEEMKKSLPMHSRQGEIYNFGMPKREVV